MRKLIRKFLRVYFAGQAIAGRSTNPWRTADEALDQENPNDKNRLAMLASLETLKMAKEFLDMMAADSASVSKEKLEISRESVFTVDRELRELAERMRKE